VRIGTTAGEYCHFRVQLPKLATPRIELNDAASMEAA
jgi:hypothetical protein